MMTISALGKDGASILPDLDGASPTGGLVQSESGTAATLLPGDVIRHFGEWVAVAAVAHNGLTGLSRVAYVSPSDGLRTFSTWPGASAEVRTDCRIDPDTLYQLTREQVPA